MKKGTDDYRGAGAGVKMGGGVRGATLRQQAFSSFKNPVYCLYYGSLIGQMAAMNMQLLARSLLIYRLTGSAAILGAMSFAFAIPMLGLSLFGGVIADRMQKRDVMLIGQAGSVVVALGVALALTLGYLSEERAGSWWILIVASVLEGTIMALVMPSRQAILPEIVGEEQLMNAISLTSLAMNVLRLLAPALAGFLVDAIGFEAVYYVMSGMYFMAAVFVVFLPPTSPMSRRGGGALSDVKEGLQYIRRQTAILFVLLFTLLSVIFSMPYMMLLPIFADDILKVGATGMGILMSVSGAGAIIGSLVLATLPNKRRGAMLLAGGLFLGLTLAVFSFSSSWYLSLALIALVGLGHTGRMTLGNILLQYYTEEEYRGRVMSIYMMEFGLMSFGTFSAGLLSEAVGVQWALGSFGMVLALLSVLAMGFLPQIRKLD